MSSVDDDDASLDISALTGALPLAQPSSSRTTPLASTTDTLPPSPPWTPTPLPSTSTSSRLSRSRSPAFFEHYGRRGSLPLATPPDPSEPPSVPRPGESTHPTQPQPTPSALEDDAPSVSAPPPVVPLDTLRALAISGADFAHFPGVSFHPTGGGGKHTVIHRAVPGGVFGPDLAARLVAHLAAEPILSPWLSPRASPSLLPLALMPDAPDVPDPKTGDKVDGSDEPTCSAQQAISQIQPQPQPQPQSRSSSHSRAPSTATWTPRTPGKLPNTTAVPRTPPPLTLPLALATVASPSPRRMPEAWWSGSPSVRAAAWSALMDDDIEVPLSRIVWAAGGSFGIARDAAGPGPGAGSGSPLVSPQTARSSVDWSVLSGTSASLGSSAGIGAINAMGVSGVSAPNGANGAGAIAPTNTFSFLPPFDEDDADMLRALVQAAAPLPVRRSTSHSRSRAGRSAAPSPEIIPSTISGNEATESATLPMASLSLSAPTTPTSARFQGLGLDSTPTDTDASDSAITDTGTITTNGNGHATPKDVRTSQGVAPAAQPTPRRNTLSLFGLSPRKARK